MPTSIYNNFDLQKQAPLDAKLTPVADASALLDPNVASNFLFEGATIYVKSEKVNYRVEVDPSNSSNLIWVKQSTTALVQGIITITSTTTNLDLSLVTPAIASCNSVLIKFTSGANTANISTITNFPTDVALPFFTETGKQVVFKHTEYDVANTGRIVLEDGFDMTIHGRTVGNEQLILKKDDTAIVQYGAVQFLKKSEWAQSLLSIAVADNLTTNSSTLALSAGQGKILQDTKQKNLSVTPRLSLSSAGLLDVVPYPWVAINVIWTADRALAVNTNGISQIAAWIADGLLSAGIISGASLVGTDTLNNRYVDMRPGTNNTYAIDFGLWFLPAGLNATVTANWICIDAPYKAEQIVYTINPVLDILAVTGDDEYLTVSFNSNSGVGTLRNLQLDSFIGGTAHSFKPPYMTSDGYGTYEVTYEIHMYSTKTVDQRIMLNTRYTTDLITSPSLNILIPGSVDINNVCNSYDPRNPATLTGGAKNFELRNTFRFTGSLSKAFHAVLRKPEGLNGDWEGISLHYGWLTITKLS